MKLTHRELKALIQEAITKYQCLNHSAGFIEPDGSVHILPQERLGVSRRQGFLSFKRGPVAHKRYLKARGITEDQTKDWLVVSNITDIALTTTGLEKKYVEQITPQQWDAYFKNFFEPCIDIWRSANPSREFVLYVGREPFTLEQLFSNQYIASSLT